MQLVYEYEPQLTRTQIDAFIIVVIIMVSKLVRYLLACAFVICEVSDVSESLQSSFSRIRGHFVK